MAQWRNSPFCLKYDVISRLLLAYSFEVRCKRMCELSSTKNGFMYLNKRKPQKGLNNFWLFLCVNHSLKSTQIHCKAGGCPAARRSTLNKVVFTWLHRVTIFQKLKWHGLLLCNSDIFGDNSDKMSHTATKKHMDEGSQAIMLHLLQAWPGYLQPCCLSFWNRVKPGIKRLVRCRILPSRCQRASCFTTDVWTPSCDRRRTKAKALTMFKISWGFCLFRYAVLFFVEGSSNMNRLSFDMYTNGTPTTHKWQSRHDVMLLAIQSK